MHVQIEMGGLASGAAQAAGSRDTRGDVGIAAPRTPASRTQERPPRTKSQALESVSSQVTSPKFTLDDDEKID